MESKQDITGLSWPRLKVWLARHRANPAAPLKIAPKPELTIRRVMQSTTLNHMNAFSPAETPPSSKFSPISQVTKLFCVNDENLAIEIALRKVCFFNTPNILCPKKRISFSHYLSTLSCKFNGSAPTCQCTPQTASNVLVHFNVILDLFHPIKRSGSTIHSVSRYLR
jgi:hypothetical protein